MDNFERIFPATLAYTVVQFRYVTLGDDAPDIEFDWDLLWETVRGFFMRPEAEQKLAVMAWWTEHLNCY
ncbi:hypothetical protein CALCODRAFT_481305 [Calocera cornea HHB12733]|uniref:Uncharacterized protein n=1 Tax=Calocera cornea HHB12733 TaxID=1353952 RepID=A0A165HVK9_9BASI|nr:hypothetical protein CALCODRAFT_481305 [Calocera cornea HHB12733]